MSATDLEWGKVLAAPIAAMIIAFVAPLMALRGFRRQKLAERRIRWYETMIQRLHRVRDSYSEFRNLGEEETVVARQRVFSASRVAMLAGMYAEPAGVYNSREWYEKMPLGPDALPTTSPGECEEIFEECLKLEHSLIVEIRKEFTATKLPKALELPG